MSNTNPAEPTLKSRLAAELRSYGIISLYLFVCFSVVLIYEASQSASKDATWFIFAIAMGKALVIGKFILIGEALAPGRRIGAKKFLHRVVWRTASMAVVLIFLKFLEEAIIGLIHSQGISELIAELAQQSWIALLGPALLMLLILVPLILVTEIDRALGQEGLKGLLFESEH